MSVESIALAVPGVRRLRPYEPGKPIEELKREYGVKDIIKLASNENPLGPGVEVVEALKKEARNVARYPDGNGFALKAALAAKLSVESSQLTLGNGSNDILELVARAFVNPGDEVVFSQHAFAVYPIVTQAVGGSAVIVPAVNWGHDLEKMVQAITPKTRVIFIANPNNPTGTWLSGKVLNVFLESVPETIIVVVDEAYFEYVDDDTYPDSVAWLSRFSNMVVTRTFSKAYGLAGLRVGYGISSNAIADILNRVRQPFNVNSLALCAAETALADEQHLLNSIEINKKGMRQLTSAFDELGLEYIPSAGNFVSVDVGQPSTPAYEALLKTGIIVRPVANYEMPNHLRVTVGLPEENRRFIEAIRQIVS